MRHMTGSVYAVFDRPVNMYRGTTMAGIITDESKLDPSRGFVGGYEMETTSRLSTNRVLLPGLQDRREVVDAVRRNSRGRGNRQA